MNITSAKFIKGLVSDDPIMDDGIPQIAFIGRSNVGKSSLINALTKSAVSRTSSTPGRTAEINFFLINDSFYFVDLPGYGYAKVSFAMKDKLASLISTYLFNNVYTQKKVVLIFDINVGMTDKDMLMFEDLKSHNKNIIIVLSKVDKITQKDFHKKLKEIETITGNIPLFQISSKNGVGVSELIDELLS
ncbi:MAG: ribosome biogenesis GTP-binding protein YihA/YsxC [Candidatus Nomurabacteria bacterium]|nr:ribosome biogenesis GTP-binding protein YihA/YsxC [Candidatus Nomurabacteria bacterium]